LEATPIVSKHFLQKKHLPSQEEKLLDNGKLLLTFYVTDYMEISPMIKKWIPNLILKEPLEWREKLIEELSMYLNKLSIE